MKETSPIPLLGALWSGSDRIAARVRKLKERKAQNGEKGIRQKQKLIYHCTVFIMSNAYYPVGFSTNVYPLGQNPFPSW